MSEQIRVTSVTIPEIHTIPPDRDTVASCDSGTEAGTGEWCEAGEEEHGAPGTAGLAKVRLQRSHAIRDSASPPPPGYGASQGSQGTQTSHTPPTMSEGGSERSTGEILLCAFAYLDTILFLSRK